MNILFVGAHHDDLEISAGGSIKKWSAEGHTVYSVILTNSKWRSPDNIICRENEPIIDQNMQAAEILGYTPVDLVLSNALELEYKDAAVVKLLTVIKEKSIDTMLTIWPSDAHPDHQVVSKIALAASRKVPRVLLTKISWNSVPQAFNPTFFVDITETLETKLKSLRCYAGEYERTGALWEKQVRASASIYGLECNCCYAEAFEVLKYLY